MSNFTHHEACPSCGSKDNLGVWDDGHKFCFGCKYYEPGTNSVHQVFNPQIVKTTIYDYPYDACEDIPITPLKWLLNCGITFRLQKDFGIEWSDKREMLCWKIYGISGRLLGWQGRCFSPKAKTKYFTQGRIHEDICLIYPWDNPNNPVILVEDYISAIRVGQILPCLVLFGCVCSMVTLYALSNRFSSLKVWLDADKLDNARKIASHASIVGLKSKVIYTPKDPKEYSDSDIKKYLTNV
jgi:hypothetical protein